MDGIVLTKERQIQNPKGDIFHIMKDTSEGYNAFGEAYFTFVKKGEIKGWKRHNKMTLNLAVPVGEVEFVVFNDHEFQSYYLSSKNYYRLTISPGLWVAFRGLQDKENLIINIADIKHDPEESTNKELEEIEYEWN